MLAVNFTSLVQDYSEVIGQSCGNHTIDVIAKKIFSPPS